MRDLTLGNLSPWQSHHVNRDYSLHCSGLSLQRSPHEVITEQLIVTRQTAANKHRRGKNVVKSGVGGERGERKNGKGPPNEEVHLFSFLFLFLH